MTKPASRTGLFIAFGTAALITAAVFSLFFGSTNISWQSVIQALFEPDLANSQQIAIRELRFPRTLGDILVGASLAVSGAVMQGITRNPLADSGILGINSGAAFALALCLALVPGMSFSGVVFFSFLGAAISTFVLYALMRAGHRRADPIRLVLAGTAISTLLSSLSQALSILANIGQTLTFWTAGGVAGIRMNQLVFAAPVMIIALAAAILLSRRISLLSLGEEAARGLGLNVEVTMVLCLAVVLALAGTSVALAGPIAFVGLLVPHVVSYFVGGSYTSIIPCSMIAGSFFMIVADLISRVINAPAETPIGLIFSVIGVPVFIYLARKGASADE